jgi:2-polyprenyl-3-methyl-5-hydroxy-6-metoxy-1,4-benzoquinol methylase
MPDASTQSPPRTLPHPGCPLCSRIGIVVHECIRDRAHGVAGEWSTRSCSACQIGWLDPQPIDEDIGLCYPGVYYTHTAGQAVRWSPLGTPGLKGRVRAAILSGRYGYEVPGVGAGTCRLGRVLGMVGPIRHRVAYSKDHSLPVWRPGGRLLDIGCGAGGYLSFARSLGWRTYGLDPDPVAAEIAGQSGATVEVGTLDAATLPDAPFDAVTSMHSIEHARDPRRFLRQALALLRPGGFFYLQTPNFGSLMHRRYGADWFALEIPRHLCLLTVPAMRRLLDEMGPWVSLTVRSNPRGADREQEHAITMRRTGRFEPTTPFSRRDRFGMGAWSLIEMVGNRTMNWGEEVEVIGIKG